MKVDGMNGMNLQANQMGTSQGVDTVTKSIQTQIATAQMQLQRLSSNEEMSMEEKQQKRQEIQKQITELNNELRQHQIEMRNGKNQEKQNVTKPIPEKDEKSVPEETSKKGISSTGMEAMISADTALKQAKVYDEVTTSIRGEIRVLEGEIEQDSARGADTEEKQNALERLEERAASTSGVHMKILSQATHEIPEAVKEEMQSEDGAGTVKRDKEDKILHVAAKEDVQEKTRRYALGKMYSSVDVHI